MKAVIASRNGASWAGGRKWGPDPVMIEVDAELEKHLKDAVIGGLLIYFPMPEKAEKAK